VIRWIFPTSDVLLTWLKGDSLTLGRGDECDVQLEGAEISRCHARFEREGALWVLRDLKSRNGVYVRGERTERAVVGLGDLVRLGEWVGRFEEAPVGHHPAPFRLLADGLWAGERLATALEGVVRAAVTDLPIVLVGETGTGKEVVARALHAMSGRPGAFVGVNCAALPDALAEAELFGHRKGAFTGATAAGTGYFRAAHQGTLLLDEVNDLPLPLQAKLLRVLELKEVVPLGETTPIPVDIRVVAAAQVPLEKAVDEGRFRGDLCARLEGLVVKVPALRERIEDVPALFGQFLLRAGNAKPPLVEPELIERLCLYDWPFNVRELQLLARRLVAVHGQEPQLKAAHLPEHFGERSAKEGKGPRKGRDGAELEAFVAALREHAGNVAGAARAVGISRQRAYRLMGAASRDSGEDA
jgi:transcriptional regulator with PAS, ATPase and Fis domain